MLLSGTLDVVVFWEVVLRGMEGVAAEVCVELAESVRPKVAECDAASAVLENVLFCNVELVKAVLRGADSTPLVLCEATLCERVSGTWLRSA